MVVQLIFSPEDQDLIQQSWHTRKDYPCRTRYSSGKHYKEMAHRIVLSRILGRELIKGEISDHINGNILDCRRENLRVTDTFGNMQNRPDNPFRGTTFHKKLGKWQACVGSRGKLIYLGLYADRLEAAAVAASKRKELGFLERATV